MKYYHKRGESLYIKYRDVNNLYRWEMTQKLIVDISKWLEETSQFNKVYIKNYSKHSDAGYLLEVHVQYRNNLLESHNY